MLILDERVWARFAKKVAWPATLTACWPWTAAKDPAGYGRIKISGKNTPAHRVAYTMMVGPIPPGLTIDHLCRTHECVNPLHMEPVTRMENSLRGVSPRAQNRRKTHCPKGHPYDERNTMWRRKGQGDRVGRNCRACDRARSRVARWRRNGVAPDDIPATDASNGFKTHCPKGHPYDLLNTLWRRHGGRDCRACNRERCRARTHAHAARRVGPHATH